MNPLGATIALLVLTEYPEVKPDEKPKATLSGLAKQSVTIFVIDVAT